MSCPFVGLEGQGERSVVKVVEGLCLHRQLVEHQERWAPSRTLGSIMVTAGVRGSKTATRATVVLARFCRAHPGHCVRLAHTQS